MFSQSENGFRGSNFGRSLVLGGLILGGLDDSGV